MTEEHKASRTIVKSPPELWAECSVAQSLARHLGEFGEIRITRLEPETTVAWEGEHASGTVRLEPSGWGTQVTLTATPIITAAPEPEVISEAAAEPGAGVAGPEPGPVFEPEAVFEPEPVLPGPVLPGPVHEPDTLVEPEAVEDVDNGNLDHQPRWPVFARIWARLGRRSHYQRHGENSAAPESDKAESVAEFEEDRRPAEAPPEPVTHEPEPVERILDPIEQAPGTVEQAPGTLEQAPEPVPQLDHQAMLVGALDSLGQAHHRPFSRA